MSITPQPGKNWQKTGERVITRKINLAACLLGGWALISSFTAADGCQVERIRETNRIHYHWSHIQHTHTCRHRKGLFTHINTQNWFLHEWWTLNLQKSNSGEEGGCVSVPWISPVILARDLTELAAKSWIMRFVSLASLSVQYVVDAAAVEMAHKSRRAASVN